LPRYKSVRKLLQWRLRAKEDVWRASGAHLWADQFDEDVADLFKLQDEVVTRLARRQRRDET